MFTVRTSALVRQRSRSGLLLAAAVLLLLSPIPAAAAPGTRPAEVPPPDSVDSTDAYVPKDVRPTCARIAGKLSSLSLRDCLARPLRPTGSHSIRGTPILLAEYPPLASRDPLGRVLLIGGIHGDEYSSVSIVFKWLAILDRFHSGLFHWRVAPLMNPDGLLRKKSQRMNGRGVDLNRNFPSPNWLLEAEDYWVRRTSRNPRRYPGPAPLSEPESQWLYDEIEAFKPSVIVSVHAPSHVVDYDGPSDPPRKLGPLHLKLMGTYPGSLGRYAGVHKGLPVVTIELPSAGIMPTTAQQDQIWADLVRYLRVNVPKVASRGSASSEVGAAPKRPRHPLPARPRASRTRLQYAQECQSALPAMTASAAVGFVRGFATSPSSPDIGKPMLLLEAGYTCAVVPKR